MNFLRRVLQGILTVFQKISLTDLGKTVMATFTGLLGSWIARFVAGYFMKKAEREIDKGVETIKDNLQVNIEDKEHSDEAKQNVEKIKSAQTDQALDDAFRDSLD